MDGFELRATCLWGMAWWGEGRGMGKEQGSLVHLF